VRPHTLRAVAAVSVLVICSFTTLSAKTWTGAVSALWSNPANWSPQAIPAVGEPLTFPNANLAMVNDLPWDTAVGALTFQGGNVSILNYSSLMLMGDVTFDANNAYSFTCSAPLKIGTALKINGSWNTNLDSIDVNGQTLTVNNVHPFVVKHLNGSGTVNANGAGVEVAAGGAFSGTLTGTWDIIGSLPGANVNATTLTGIGTVGNVAVSYLRPGMNLPGSPDVHNVAYLQTKSLTILQEYGVDLTFSGSDQTNVTGSVTITGASLVVSLPTGGPAAGIPITIISNDGSDPVVGTFNGLPEGATFTADGTPFRISYHGGDGNDITLTPGSGVKSFVGLYHALWSNPLSWTPQALPVAGEPLSFALSTTAMINDLPAGFTAGAMSFKGGNVDLEGNALTLTGDLSFAQMVSAFTCDVPVKIGHALTLGAAQSSFYSVVDVNAQTLTVNTSLTAFGQFNGSGTIVLNGPGARIDSPGTFTGPIYGSVDLNGGLLPNADIAGAFLTGNGTVGNVVVTTLRPGSAAGVPSGNDTHAVGVLQTRSLTLAGGSYDVDLDPHGASDLVLVKGDASISGALNVSLPSVPALGQSFVIIDNDGTDKINGTFTNLPEGAAVHSGNTLFRISYAGGNGNDVELITAEQPVITVTQPKSSTVIGEKATLIASFAAGMPSPLGSLTFAADGVPIGTAPITNGSAAIDVSSFAIGDRVITASWAGGGAFLSAVSAPLTHTVRRGDTSTTLVAVDPLVYGSSRFTVSAAVIAPAVTPLSGSVTLRENGIVVGTATLAGNAATINAPSLHPGLHIFIASYEGSSTLLASESRPLTVSISPAETRLVVSNEEAKLTVVASSASGVVDIPTGTLTVAENGNTIAVEPINGTANITLTLNPGTHHLTVIYSGDANFLSDTVQYDITIESPPSSRHRGVRH